MTSPVLSELHYDGAFLIREATGYRSRDVGTVSNSGDSDLVLEGGTVMATLTADSSLAAYTGAGSTGTATASCILFNTILVPAGASKQVTIVARDAEVNAAEVLWDSSATDALKTSAITTLTGQGLIFR